MARLVKNFAQVDGPIWALLFTDGSLRFEIRNEEPNVEWSFGKQFELSPESVKVLLEVLDRAAEQRDEAAGEGAGESPKDLRTED